MHHDRMGWQGPDRYKTQNKEPRFPLEGSRYHDKDRFPPRGFRESGGHYRRDFSPYRDDPYRKDPYVDDLYRHLPPDDWEYEERMRRERLRDIEQRLDMELGIDRQDPYDLDR